MKGYQHIPLFILRAMRYKSIINKKFNVLQKRIHGSKYML